MVKKYNHLCFSCKKRWTSKNGFVRRCNFRGNTMKNKLFNGTHLKPTIVNRIVIKQKELKV